MGIAEDFAVDSKVGFEAEERVLALVKDNYPKAHRVTGYKKEYDIYIPELDNSIEVKYDARSKDTGNIFIEMKCNNKPSGLNVTAATWWIIDTGIEYIIIRPEKLWQIIESHKPKLWTGLIKEQKMEGHLIREGLIIDYSDGIKHY